MTTFFVIRKGWNAANQSSIGSIRNPKNNFQSKLYSLVGIIEAKSEQEAIRSCSATCYNGQCLFATSNPRSVKGLTQEIREFQNEN